MAHRKHKGSQSELKAICKLWDMGYEVFRNQSSHGLADLIVWDPKEAQLRKFDVKTAADKISKNGVRSLYCEKLSQEQLDAGVELILVTHDRIIVGFNHNNYIVNEDEVGNERSIARQCF